VTNPQLFGCEKERILRAFPDDLCDRLKVTVHGGDGRRDGDTWWRNAASTASVRKERTWRCCLRSV
jgi:hypothetical protein